MLFETMQKQSKNAYTFNNRIYILFSDTTDLQQGTLNG